MVSEKESTDADSGAGSTALLGSQEVRSGERTFPTRRRLDSGERYSLKSTTRTRVRDFCEDPSFSKQAFWFHSIFSAVIVASIFCFVIGTNNDTGKVDPTGPSPEALSVLEAIFTIIFIVDISVRFVVADVKCCFFRKPYESGYPMALDLLFWLDILSVVPYPVELLAKSLGFGDYTTLLSFFNLFRICRIFKITRQFDGTKVLVATVSKSSEAIIIQVLFLLTMVFTFGFLLFLFEPCLGQNINAIDDSCEFPDLLQSSYFLFITITTVGYGDQIPVTTMGKILAVLLAILGSFYMAMPLAIIGSKFEEAYQEREIKKLQKKGQDVKEMFKAKLDKVPMSSLKVRVMRLALKLSNNVELLIAKHEKKLHEATCVVLDRFIIDLRRIYQAQVAASAPTKKKLRAKKLFQLGKSKLKKVAPSKGEKKMFNLANLHAKLKQKESIDYAQATFKYEQEAKLNNTFRNRMWLLFEVPTSSVNATRLNVVKMFIIACSLLLLIVQSMSMFNDYGQDSRLCRQVINFYCEKLEDTDTFRKANPACFPHEAKLLNSNGTLAYPGCRSLTPSTFDSCGFPNADLGFVCKSTYGPNETQPFDNDYFLNELKLIPICDREQCANSIPEAKDNSALWLTLETIFAVLFCTEICVRLYLMRAASHFFSSPYNIVDVCTGLLCLAEVIYVPARWGAPKFEIWGNGDNMEPANIRFWRIGVFLRFISLQKHFVGLKVIFLTIKAVWKKMVIPLLFFIIFVLLFAGMFYTFERGSLYECVNDSFLAADCEVCRPSTHNLYDGTCALKVVGQFSSVELLEPKVQNMWDSIWTMFITTTTVGYGGKYPQTVPGQVVSVFAAIFGSFYLSMPLTIIGNSFYSIFDKEWTKVLKRRNTRRNLNYVTSTKKKAYSGKFSLGLIVKLKRWAKRAKVKLRHAELNKAELTLMNEYFQIADVFLKFDGIDEDETFAETLKQLKSLQVKMNGILSQHLITDYSKWIPPSERLLYKI